MTKVNYTINDKAYEVFLTGTKDGPMLTVTHYNYNGELKSSSVRLEDVIKHLIQEMSS